MNGAQRERMPSGFMLPFLEIQLSTPTCTEVPLPIGHMMPSQRRSPPCKMLHHVYEPLFEHTSDMKSQSLKYLTFRTCANNELCAFEIFYACLANNA